ncbi:GtrA family protein [Bacillus sp. 03113]|uniref:GtrA family protein n=1 Tax=Bacillus sp. 03113 TaxID=2578211 RepID=UPI0011443CBD|nr:GtrA family protein [Bacillus sp. 03113]
MKQKKELVLYLVFGVLTTLVNIITYVFVTKLLYIDYKIATTIAWILSVLFAFITNKLFVFNSKETNLFLLIKETFLFFMARFLSYLLDIGLMILLVEQWHMNDILSKVVVNVLVVILNYAASKYLIFHKKSETGKI